MFLKTRSPRKKLDQYIAPVEFQAKLTSLSQTFSILYICNFIDLIHLLQI